MQSIEVHIGVKNYTTRQEAQQVIAGALPTNTLRLDTVPFRLDGATNEELLYKFLINAAVVFFKATTKNEDEMTAALIKFKDDARALSSFKDTVFKQ